MCLCACQCGNNKCHPSHISPDNLKELWPQQEIEEVHNNKVVNNNQPTFDSKNHAASTDLIEHHVLQIWCIDGAPCVSLM